MIKESIRFVVIRSGRYERDKRHKECSSVHREWRVLGTIKVLPRKSHGQRSLTGYSPWGHKESDTTEWHRWKNSWKGARQNDLESHLQSPISDRI